MSNRDRIIAAACCIVLAMGTLIAQLPVPGGSTGGGGGGSESTSVSNSGAGSAVLKAGSNVTARTIVAGSNVTVTQNTDDITIAASGGGMADPGGNGVMVRTASNTSTNRTITGTANKITVTNGDGVSGNPTLTIADALDLSGHTSTKPSKTGTSAPGTCAVGETFIDTDASAAAQFLVCTATNTWTAQGSGSGDVTAASAFTNDNRLVRSDGTGKGVQASGITIDDSANMTGVTTISVGNGSDVGTVTLLEGTAPSAPGTAGEHTLYFDSTGNRLKSKANGGAVTDYATLAGAETLTNKEMTLPKVTTGTSAAASGDCDASGELGRIYVQTGDPASVASRVSVCTQTGTSTYGWNPISHKVGTTAPATCAVGEIFMDSDATAGQNVYACTASNTWTLQGDGTGGGGGSSITAGNGQIWVWGWPGTGSNFTPVANTVYYMRFTLPVTISLRYIQNVGNRTGGNYMAGAIYDVDGNKVSSTDWRANGQGTTAYDVGDLGSGGVTLNAGVYFIGYVVEAGSVYGYPYMFGGQANQISGAPQNFSGSNAATGSGATLTMPSAIGTKTNVGLDTTSLAAMLVTK